MESPSMSKIGLGTWQMRGSACTDAVRHALDVGYRHIDTAQLYANEKQVGDAMAASSVPREDIFVTSKVWRDSLEYRDVIATTEQSLTDLQTPYVDLMLLHWPHDGVSLERSLDALVALQQRGLVRHIGVSNYHSKLLARAADHAPLFCTQLEYHVFLHVGPVLEVARQASMKVAAYCPLARGGVVDTPLLREIGMNHGCTAAQVALRWLTMQDGVVAVPKSTTPSRIVENLASLEVVLTHDERKRIDELNRDQRLIDPDFVEWDSSATVS